MPTPAESAATAVGGDPTLWSVVAIARNEQATIAACFDSARKALGDRRHELILVDSNSNDGTAEAAAAVAGVRVLRLPAHPLLGPSLGRYIGGRAARGARILFLDGDMLLLPGWLPLAAAALEQDSQLAGVAGDMEHRLSTGETVRHVYPPDDYQCADYLGGAALYRRDALAHAGHFNPYLRASEEEELGARLRKCGYTLRRLDTPMTRHHPVNQDLTLAELWRRLRRGYLQGAGQMARHAISDRLPVARPLQPISKHLLFTALLALGPVMLALGLSGAGWLWAWGWLALLLSLFVLFALKARSLRRPVFYFAEWLLGGPSVVYGLLRQPRRAEDFVPPWTDAELESNTDTPAATISATATGFN